MASGESANFPFFAVSTQSALPCGSSQPRATLCPEGRRTKGRKGCAAYSTSDSESVKTIMGEPQQPIHRTVFHTQKLKKHTRGHTQPCRPLDTQPACCSSGECVPWCPSTSVFPAGSGSSAPAARGKSSSSIGRQHGNTKPLLGYVIEDKSLNLLNLSLSTHKMGIVTHIKRFIVITEITHAKYLPEGLEPREHSISGTCTTTALALSPPSGLRPPCPHLLLSAEGL